MEQHLVEHRTQNVAAAGCGNSSFYCFRDGAPQASGGVGITGQNCPAGIGGIAGAGNDFSAKGLNDGLAIGLLLSADLYHIDCQGNLKVRTGHGESGAPLSCAGLGGQAGEPLLLGIVHLSHCGVELVAARGVVSLKFIVDFGRRAQLLFQIVGADQGRGTVELCKIPGFPLE